MKLYPIIIIVTLVCAITACTREHSFPHGHEGMNPTRKVRYELYTIKNQAGNKHNITFSLFMRNTRKVLLDSALATMKVEDIPDSLHRIIIEKPVPGNDTAALAVGFFYHEEDVGTSSHLDSFPANQTLQVVRFPFQ